MSIRGNPISFRVVFRIGDVETGGVLIALRLQVTDEYFFDRRQILVVILDFLL